MKLFLPPGKVQFCDINGVPLAGGFVHHYIPATSTPKDTWQDVGGTILNTNPIVLDAAGEAVILGNGGYRQVVTDRLGNEQWDQVVTVPDGADKLPLTGGTLTGALAAPSISDTGGQLLTVAPTGDAVTTLASLNVQGVTTSTVIREYLAAISLISNKRNGTAGSVSPTAALYTGIDGQNGTDDIWSIKTTLVQSSASGTYDAIGHEITVANSNAHRGDAAGAAGLVTPFTYGLAIDAPGTFRSTAALIVTSTAGSKLFNRGIVVTGNSVAQATFQDLGAATLSYDIQGSHIVGVETRYANFAVAALRLGNGQSIKSRDIADTLDYSMLVQSNNFLVIGDATATNVSAAVILPSADNTLTLGNSGFRWSAVWAANGTIQTSDPTLKTDVEPISDADAMAVLHAIDPITFRWVSGGKDADGNDRPGRRTHWGWDAGQVKSAFDGIGKDFGGYVLADGVQHLRPDQLVPVLWRAVRTLTARIEVLESWARIP